jgi:hypothetical protein
MVALTGIEWVRCQFTSVQLSLSRFVSVQFVLPWLAKPPYKTLWCERGVSARMFPHSFGSSEVQ